MERKKNMKVLEVIDSRVLCAIRFIDHSTESVIRKPLQLTAGGVRFIRNLSSYYVVSEAPGLGEHVSEFETPPTDPPAGDIQIIVSVEDPSQTYLPRIMTIDLPRDPDPENTDNADSLFLPVDVTMYPASHISTNFNWSLVRGSVFSLNGLNRRIPVHGALLRLIRTDDGAVLARGISDRRGEFLVTVPGIPITNFSNGENDDDNEPNGPVTVNETSVSMEVIVDPGLPWPVNPDDLEQNRTDWLRNEENNILLILKTGKTETIEITVDLADGS
jgi:hypothetical protein